MKTRLPEGGESGSANSKQLVRICEAVSCSLFILPIIRKIGLYNLTIFCYYVILKIPVSDGLGCNVRTSVLQGLGHSVRTSVLQGLGHSVKTSVLPGLGHSVRTSVLQGLGHSVKTSVLPGLGHSEDKVVT